jgi:YD repeat-containing protein
MRPAFFIAGLAALLLAACGSVPATMAERPLRAPQVSEYRLGPAYAATEINATIFRLQAVTSDAHTQYAVYYDPAGNITVARRALGDAGFTLETLPIAGRVRDAHNDVVLGLSADGVLHLSYDHHNEPLHYRFAADGGNLAELSPEAPMTGRLESRVTYPTFIPDAAGGLYFFYRDGQSGNGRLCVNHYDPATHVWSIVQSPLLEGAGWSSPYWWRPEVGPDGVLHVAWCWRDSPDASTNHDICYVCSRDGGRTWQNSAGKMVTLPVTRDSDTVVQDIPTGQNLINSCALATDAQGRPHIAYYCNGPDGVPQYFHLWFDGVKWSAQQVSQRTQKFSLAGQGTLDIPISRPEIAISRAGTAYLITRDRDCGGGVRLYAARPPYDHWQTLDVIPGPLGDWEPTYDLARWRRDGVLSLFVLPVHQGNNETVTSFPPQTAQVVELSGLE